MTTYNITYFFNNDISGVTGINGASPRQVKTTINDLPTLTKQRNTLQYLCYKKGIDDALLTENQMLDCYRILVTCGTNSKHTHGFKKDFDYTSSDAMGNLFSVL